MEHFIFFESIISFKVESCQNTSKMLAYVKFRCRFASFFELFFCL